MPGNPPAIIAPSQLAVSPATPVQFTVTGSDPNGLPVTLSASNLPAGATFDPGSGNFQWTPTPGQTGTFNVALTATDSAGLSANKTVAITVAIVKATVLGLYNAASYALDQTCSPGSLAAVVGSGFTGQSLQVSPPAPWVNQLAGVQVLLNNVPAPILAASDSLIQFQCPMGLPGAPMTLVVQPTNALPSVPIQFTLNEATPSLFELGGATQGAILIAGTNQVAMDTTDAMPSRPANIGEYLAIYANGLGPLQSPIAANTPAPVDSLVAATDQVTVYVGNVPLTPAFAGLAPGLTGVYQINVQLLQGITIGDTVPVYVSVTLSDGTVINSNTVTVAIQNSGS
jgi:uncharacterized protein (TIGR03437 family)